MPKRPKVVYFWKEACSRITCVKALAFQSPKGSLEAQYKRQSLLFEIWFNKLLLRKKLFLSNYRRWRVGWGVKMTGRSSSTISLSIWRMKEYSFILFHLVFWKRALVLVVVGLDFLDIFVPKVHRGLRKAWRKNQEFLKKFDDFWRNFVRLLFQIYYLQNKCF